MTADQQANVEEGSGCVFHDLKVPCQHPNCRVCVTVQQPNDLAALWRAVVTHLGIVIECQGDEAAESWNRLAQAMERSANVE